MVRIESSWQLSSTTVRNDITSKEFFERREGQGEDPHVVLIPFFYSSQNKVIFSGGKISLPPQQRKA